MLSDRLLIRVLMRGDVCADEDAARVVATLDEIAVDALDTSVCVIAWALEELQHPEAARLKSRVADVLDAWNAQAGLMTEPWRSAYTYWLGRCGLLSGIPALPPPTDLVLRLYADFHTVFYASHYGRSPVTLRGAPPALVDAATYTPRMWMARGTRHNADLQAEALLTELCLHPRRDDAVTGLYNRLCSLQCKDGSFTPFNGATLVARHHASCAAALAFWMLS